MSAEAVPTSAEELDVLAQGKVIIANIKDSIDEWVQDGMGEPPMTCLLLGQDGVWKIIPEYAELMSTNEGKDLFGALLHDLGKQHALLAIVQSVSAWSLKGTLHEEWKGNLCLHPQAREMFMLTLEFPGHLEMHTREYQTKTDAVVFLGPWEECAGPELTATGRLAGFFPPVD